MCYAVNFFEQLRRAAVYVDKILKGAKASDLPVEQPTNLINIGAWPCTRASQKKGYGPAYVPM